MPEWEKRLRAARLVLISAGFNELRCSPDFYNEMSGYDLLNTDQINWELTHVIKDARLSGVDFVFIPEAI